MGGNDDDLEVVEPWLLNARHMHNVPGRKTDTADADWICRLVRHKLVRPSFVPPQPIRELRDLTLDKVLQDAGIKLSSVASDILGVSGRDMLNGLVAGTRDPEVLAELARGRLRSKIPLLQSALEGRFRTQPCIGDRGDPRSPRLHRRVPPTPPGRHRRADRPFR